MIDLIFIALAVTVILFFVIGCFYYHEYCNDRKYGNKKIMSIMLTDVQFAFYGFIA
jgi:G:T-mismatch repair DNA endonuclease (very short patch repair protein)